MTDPLLTIPEVCRYLRIGRATFYRLRQSHPELRVVKIEGSARMRQSVLERWLKQQEEAQNA